MKKIPTRRIIALMPMLLLFAALFSACGDVILEPKWVIGVEGTDAAVFSSIDYNKLEEMSVTVERQQPDGSIIEETLQGVYLKDVLDYLGITEYSSVTLNSRDDFTVEYSPAIVDDITTILVVNVDGEEVWEDGFAVIQVTAGNQPEDMWLWGLKTLTVNP